MTAIIIICAILLFILAIYLFLIAPRVIGRADMKKFRGVIFAHRGMFDNPTIPENSMKAFELAVKNGYGIEFDLHLSADNKIVVFHDDTLKRICGDDKEISDLTYDELLKYTLFESGEKIPLFTDVLKLVDGKVPLLIELKGTSSDTSLADAAYEVIKNYSGQYCIESFNPLLVHRWRQLSPRDAAGLLITHYVKKNDGKKRPNPTLMNSLILNVKARPDFLACDIKHDKQLPIVLSKALFRPYTASWTIRTEDEFKKCRKSYDMTICENLDKIAHDS